MRKLQVTLEIDVADLPKEQRKELAREQECKASDLPSLKDTEAGEVASVLEGIGMEGISEELFAGSDVYVRFTDARIVNAAWATA
jgi:hypothetical protein